MCVRGLDLQYNAPGDIPGGPTGGKRERWKGVSADFRRRKVCAKLDKNSESTIARRRVELGEYVELLRTLGDLLRGSNVRIVHLIKRRSKIGRWRGRRETYLGGEPQGTQRLVHVNVQGRQVQHHQCFRVSAQRMLQEVCQLSQLVVSGFVFVNRERSTLEFLYGICLSLFPSPFSPNAAMTSPRALKLLLMFCVSFSLSLSFPAPLFSSRSEPARSTRLSEPSQESPLAGFFPDIRRVKTECDRDERSLAEAVKTRSVSSGVSWSL